MDNLKCKNCGSPALVFSRLDEAQGLDDDEPQLQHIYICLNCGKEQWFDDDEVYQEPEPGDDDDA